MFLLNFIAKLIFKVNGWRVEGTLPPKPRKFVLIIAPHTSKWDVVYAIGAGATVDLQIRFLVNEKEVKHIQGPVMLKFGGIPINKEENKGIVQKVVDLFQKNEDFVLALNPEGGLAKCDDFRTGFYHIARAANVPVLMSYFDYKRKVIGIGEFYHLTGDMQLDFDHIWNFYKDKPGKYPELGVFGERKPKEKTIEKLAEASFER